MQVAALVAVVIALPAAAQTVRFDCHGSVKTDKVFDGGAVEHERQWTLVANYDAGYVKRAPELAAGCVERRVEVCGCTLDPGAIRCRSLGITPEGVEVGMDFSLDRAVQRLTLSGRRFEPQSGSVTETAGVLECTESTVRP